MASTDKTPFIVRAQSSNTGFDGAFRVQVLQEHLHQAGLKFNDMCEITGGENGKTLLGYAIAWRATENMGNTPKHKPAKVTEHLRNAFAIKDGSQIYLAPTSYRTVAAEKIILTDVTPPENGASKEGVVEDKKWKTRCHYLLVNSDGFASGVSFEANVATKKHIKKRFYIASIEASGVKQSDPNLFHCDDDTHIVLADVDASRPTSSMNAETESMITSTRIGGLAQQLEGLNCYLKNALADVRANFERTAYKGALIHGYEGTGKSLLLDEIEQTASLRTLRLARSKLNGQSVAKGTQIIEEAFRRAEDKEPCFILVDEIDALAPQSGDLYGATILDEIERVKSKRCRVAVIAACRDPNQVYSQLRRAGRFSTEIELPIPDVEARASILNVLLGRKNDDINQLSDYLKGRTHGFTGSDLALLVEKAQMNRDKEAQRTAKWQPQPQPVSLNGSLDTLLDGAAHSQAATQLEAERRMLNEVGDAGGSLDELSLEDFDAALKEVRPTALREIFFEKPNIQWSDIGGSQLIKDRFDKIIAWPSQHAEQSTKFMLKSKQGVLLYGPPGCSKTLTAQAVATNYDLNFIAVKAAELISMYVGESERAVREIFQKARSAAPCVIFFDEIDSIASEREGSGTKGLNVLTTLLTEMDGFQPLKGVLVLAATNKPASLDPAIMRPGRFGAKIYLGLPNNVARKEIFNIQINGVPQQDIELEKLVADTEGYSGAEIVEICDTAKEQAMGRYVEALGDGESSPLTKITMGDFAEALRCTKQGITKEMLHSYAAFANSLK